jgi:hypothetical protein
MQKKLAPGIYVHNSDQISGYLDVVKNNITVFVLNFLFFLGPRLPRARLTDSVDHSACLGFPCSNSTDTLQAFLQPTSFFVVLSCGQYCVGRRDVLCLRG